MKYEIVNLKEKIVVGVSARTKNSAKDMTEVIGSLWDGFYKGGVYNKLENLSKDKAIELYSDYENDENGEYSVTVGCEVTEEAKVIENAIVKVIPAGKYAKFVVKGDAIKSVQEFWAKLYGMNLERAFICDFEEYQDDSMDNATIIIYISIK